MNSGVREAAATTRRKPCDRVNARNCPTNELSGTDMDTSSRQFWLIELHDLWSFRYRARARCERLFFDTAQWLLVGSLLRMLLVWSAGRVMVHFLSRFPATESLPKGQPLFSSGRKALGLQWMRLPGCRRRDSP